MDLLHDPFKIKLNNIIKQIIPNLNQTEFQILLNWLIDIINKFIQLNSIGISDQQVSQFENNLLLDNNQDIIGLFLLLLPYIKNFDALKTIKNLSEIYSTRTIDSIYDDPTKTSPKYLFSNIQYNRCDPNTAEEYVFDIDHLRQNYELLKITLQKIANKMYVNWNNIYPLSLSDFKNSICYKITSNHFNYGKINDEYTGQLYIGTLYETLRYYLYEDIKQIKWLLYEYNDATVFTYLINNVQTLDSGKLWNVLDEHNKNQFVLDLNKIKNYDFINSIINIAYHNYHKQDETEIQDDDIQKFKITNDIQAESMYDFLINSVNKFKETFYYKLITGTLHFNFASKNIQNIKYHLTTKNIYNFAKSFCGIYKNGFKILPVHWDSLEDKYRQLILDRFNKVNKNWLNIPRNIKRTYGDTLSNNVVMKIQKNIYDDCMTNLIDMIFSCLVTSGTLTTFENEPSKDNIEHHKNGYYFLTGQQFKNISMYDSNDNYKNKSYIDYIKTSRWQSLYAMNWVSQINFFHRFLNCNVLFITGGTGVGKSTQTPKLLLYAMKALCYKKNGKIICSQPRKKPTSANATQISDEMGVSMYTKNPILPENDETIYHPTNYNVQFQHHDDYFPKITEQKQYPILKIVTDKILLNLIKNPLFKNTFIQGDKTTIYDTSNLYDIVIVDESHEHNENMDMILTLMRNILYYNNDCKLVIISATMDEDEPVYRRYYRVIDDNMLFPLNIHNKNNNLNRINVDRRLDISIPRRTTPSKIFDHFLNYVPKSEDERNKLIIDIIKKRLLDTSTGDILVFKAGQREIKKCITLLNSILPDNTYAIPFYSELPENIRKFIENVHNNKNELKISKNIDITKLDDVEKLKIGNNHYTRVIIVATNIAEASITIRTLTDVIDDGLQKVNRFMPKLNGFMIETTYISELNRMQRRGRVGRTQAGNAYYLYPENYLKNAKTIYKICIDDITNLLFDLMKPENSKIFKFDNRDDLNRIFSKQYTILDEQFAYNNGMKLEYKIYEDGYDYDTLVDKQGSFFIVHPEEDVLNRNILGNIINDVKFERTLGYFEKLSSTFLIIENNNEYVKTSYGSEISKLMKKIFALDTFGLQYAISCVFASVYGCLDDILKIITILRQAPPIKLISCESNMKSDLLNKNLIMNNTEYEKLKNDINNYKLLDISKYLNVSKLLTHAYEKYDKITLSLLHGFGNNLVKKLSGVPNYVSIKYPLKENVKHIKKTYVIDKYLNDYLLYFGIRIFEQDDISNSEISYIHYVNPIILKHIIYQFPIKEYLSELSKRKSTNVDYTISQAYDKVFYEIVFDIKNMYQHNADEIMIFSNVYKNANDIIMKKLRLQFGGKKYKIIYK